MIEFLELSKLNGDLIYINPLYITAFQPSNNHEGTEIFLLGDETTISVGQSCRDINRALEFIQHPLSD